MNRLGSLEARATKRANLGQTLYLPVIFITYGLLLGISTMLHIMWQNRECSNCDDAVSHFRLAVIYLVSHVSGTVYLQTQDATSVLTGFGVFSCASALFMFPIIYSYLHKAMEVHACY